jgi:recombinational DNA repair protein (RecF pathway)
MYQKYHTDAVVLGSREQGETDRAVALYTREFGLVWARASAVRADSSKMRYALTHYTRAHVSLIKGKRGWRAAGAAAHVVAIGKGEAGVRAFARAGALVLRLVAGEEHNAYLFDTLASAHEALFSAEAPHVPAIELVCVARILYALGYLSPAAVGSAMFAHTAYHPEALPAEESHDELLRSINRALAETHL